MKRPRTKESDDLALHIGKNLRELSTERGIKWLTLARELGFNHSSIYRALEGITLLSTEIIVAIADHLHITTDRIIYGKEARSARSHTKEKPNAEDRKGRGSHGRSDRRQSGANRNNVSGNHERKAGRARQPAAR